MKILLLGSTGMLGRYISSYLKFYFEVIDLNRNELSAEKITQEELEDIFKNKNIKENDVIINCIGTIKPRVDELGKYIALKVNSIFPYMLEEFVIKEKLRLIHPTTDCVFSGYKGNYIETDKHDVFDVYGLTKSLGEITKSTLIRTSIIGEEINNSRSLLEWVKSNKNKEVNGYTNHIWNGITCLQFAKICKQIIDKNLFWEGIRHIYSPTTVTKSQLIKLISDKYHLNLSINEIEAPLMCDRTLHTIYNDVNKFNIPDLKMQIREQKEFFKHL